MANTRSVIAQNIMAAPDHLHARLYVAGEQHQIGSPLMPAGLSAVLAAAGNTVEDTTAVAPSWLAAHATNAQKLFAHDSPEPRPW